MALAKFKNHGMVGFLQQETKCWIVYSLYNLKPGNHGFHIHEKPFQEDCSEAGSHFKKHPDQQHGGPHSDQRHDGDLGNIVADVFGRADTDEGIYVELDLQDIYNRTIVLHEEEDDLGLKNDDESKKTGNAGKRIDCAIIKPIFGFQLKC